MTAQAGDTSHSQIEAKSALRSACRKNRKALPCAQRKRGASLAAQRLLRQRAVLRSRSFGVYLAIGSELSTLPLVKHLLGRGKSVYAPVTRADGSMIFIRLHRLTTLRTDALGFPRPAANRPRILLRQIDILVIPLLAFDSLGQRLGQGGGYYDRALEALRECRRPWRIGYAFCSQEIAEVPSAPWDIRLHAVATARGLRRFSFHAAAPL